MTRSLLVRYADFCSLELLHIEGYVYLAQRPRWLAKVSNSRAWLDLYINPMDPSLGNTCYMNATVQALRSIPELQTSLATYAPSPANPVQLSGDANGALTTGLSVSHH